MEGVTLFAVFALAMGVLIWARAHRHRSPALEPRVEGAADIHNKLMDRFTANDDCSAYIQTPAGKAVLESAPLDSTPDRAPSARRSRILWSVQVIGPGCAGFGFQIGQPQHREDVSQPSRHGILGCRSAPVSSFGDRFVHPVAQARLWEPSPAQSTSAPDIRRGTWDHWRNGLHRRDERCLAHGRRARSKSRGRGADGRGNVPGLLRPDPRARVGLPGAASPATVILATNLLQETYYRFYKAGAAHHDEGHRRNSLFLHPPRTSPATPTAATARIKSSLIEVNEADEGRWPSTRASRALRESTDLWRAHGSIETGPAQMLWLAYALGFDPRRDRGDRRVKTAA